MQWLRLMERVPEGFTSTEAASVICTYGTVWHSAVVRGNLRGGENVLVTGATGGVGSAAVQIAKAMGCRVTAVTSTENKINFLKELGADEVLVAPQGKFRGKSFDMSLEAVGAPTFESSLRCLRAVGNVTVGSPPLPLGQAILSELSIIGADSCTSWELSQVFQFLKTNKITPQIHAVLPLEEAGKAHQMLEERKVSGRIVLQINQDW